MVPLVPPACLGLAAGISIAPPEVSQLTSLQALDLSGCINLGMLPACLSRMTFLNQLRLADAFQAPLKIHHVHNLYTKWKFDLLDLRWALQCCYATAGCGPQVGNIRTMQDGSVWHDCREVY